jgi:hypothetical protein
MTPEEIHKSGQDKVRMELQARGFSLEKPWIVGTPYLMAVRENVRKLVQVKTTQHPLPVMPLSYEEKQAILSFAKGKDCEPYLAQVQIDRFGFMPGEIVWTKLD